MLLTFWYLSSLAIQLPHFFLSVSDTKQAFLLVENIIDALFHKYIKKNSILDGSMH